jgi:hypothetical protein
MLGSPHYEGFARERDEMNRSRRHTSESVHWAPGVGRLSPENSAPLIRDSVGRALGGRNGHDCYWSPGNALPHRQLGEEQGLRAGEG